MKEVSLRLRAVVTAMAFVGMSACAPIDEKPLPTSQYSDRECHYLGHEVVCGNIEDMTTIKYGHASAWSKDRAEFDYFAVTADGRKLRTYLDVSYEQSRNAIKSEEVAEFMLTTLQAKIAEKDFSELSTSFKVVSDTLGETEKHFSTGISPLRLTFLNNMVISEVEK